MADLYNNKTKAYESNISESDVNDRILSGTYDFGDRKVYVGTNDGNVLRVEGYLASDYIRAGSANYIAPRQAEGMIENKEFASSALGQLAAIPYGMEDYLGAGIFSSIGETLGIAPGQKEAVQAQNPWTWHTSGIIPSVVAAFLSGGGTALAQTGAKVAAKKTVEKAVKDRVIEQGAQSLVSRGVNTTKSFLRDYTLPGVGAKIANKVQDKTYDALMKSGAQYVPTSLGNVEMIKRFGPHAAKILSGSIAAGVEGGIWGAGEGIGEAILGEPEEAAEHIFNSIGSNMLIGVGIGGAVSAAVPMLTGAAGLGAVGLKKMIGGSSIVGGKTIKNVRPFIKAIAEKNNMPPEQVERLMSSLDEDGFEVMQQMADLKTNLDKHSSEIANLTDGLLLADDFVQLTDIGGFDINVLVDLIRATREGKNINFTEARFLADPITIRMNRQLEKLHIRFRKNPNEAGLRGKIEKQQADIENLREAYIQSNRIPNFSPDKPTMAEDQFETLMEARKGIDVAINGLRDIERQFPEIAATKIIPEIIRSFNKRETEWYRRILGEEVEDLAVAHYAANNPKPKILTNSERARMTGWESHWDEFLEMFRPVTTEVDRPSKWLEASSLDDPAVKAIRAKMDKVASKIDEEEQYMRQLGWSPAHPMRAGISPRMLSEFNRRRDKLLAEQSDLLEKQTEAIEQWELRQEARRPKVEIEESLNESALHPIAEKMGVPIRESAEAAKVRKEGGYGLGPRGPESNAFITGNFSNRLREITVLDEPIFSGDQKEELLEILTGPDIFALKMKRYTAKVEEYLASLNKAKPDLIVNKAHARKLSKLSIFAANDYFSELANLKAELAKRAPPGTLAYRLNEASRQSGRAVDFGGVLKDLEIAAQIAADTGDAGQLEAIYKKFKVKLPKPRGITQKRYKRLKLRDAPWVGDEKIAKLRADFAKFREQVTPREEGGSLTESMLRTDFGPAGRAGDILTGPPGTATVYSGAAPTLRDQIKTFLKLNLNTVELPDRVTADSFKVLEDLQTSLKKNMQYGSLPEEGFVADRIENHIIDELRRMQTDTTKWGLMAAMKSQFARMHVAFREYRGQVLTDLTRGVGPKQKADQQKIITMLNDLDSDTSSISMDRLAGYAASAEDLLEFIRINFAPIDFADILRHNPTAMEAIEGRFANINIQRTRTGTKLDPQTTMPGIKPRAAPDDAPAGPWLPGMEPVPFQAAEITEDWSDHLVELGQFVNASKLELDSSLRYIEDELPLAKLLSSNNAREANLGNVLSDMGRGGVAAAAAMAATGNAQAAAVVGLGVGSISLALDPKRLMAFVHQLRVAKQASEQVIDDYLDGWIKHRLPKSAIHKGWERNARQAFLIGAQASRRDIKETRTEVRKKIAKDRSMDAWSNRVQASLDSKLTGESYFEASKSFSQLMGSPSLMARFLEDSTKMFENTPDLRNAMMDSLRGRVAYAYSIMPQSSGGFLQEPIPPSQMELDKWRTALEVLNSPTDTLLTALFTNSITSDMVDALRSGWPKIYEQLTAKVMDTITQPGVLPGLSSEQKMSISILMGIPFMEQGELSTVLRTWARDEEGGPGQPSGRGGAGIKQIPAQYGAGTTVGIVER